MTAGDAEEAERGAAELGLPCVVKALVPANRRGRAGGVVRAERPGEAGAAARRLLGAELLGTSVEAVLVEGAVDIARELYLAVLLDPAAGAPVALASVQGGVGIEDDVAAGRAAVARRELDPWGRIQPHELRSLWAEAGLAGRALGPVAALSCAVARAALSLDATLLEVNPLAIDAAGQPVAVGALLEVDDDARDRQGWLPSAGDWSPAAWRPATPRELAARMAVLADPYRGTARFVEIDAGGDIGLVTGGGGASLVVFDAVRRAGGAPVAYTEVGGNPTAEKVRALTAAVLDCPGVRGLLVAHNLTSNTQVDLVAEGVIQALRERGLDPATFPVVAREIGTNDRAGRAALAAAGIETLGEEAGLEDAAARIVERVREAA